MLLSSARQSSTASFHLVVVLFTMSSYDLFVDTPRIHSTGCSRGSICWITPATFHGFCGFCWCFNCGANVASDVRRRCCLRDEATGETLDVYRRCQKVSDWGPASSGQLLEEFPSSSGWGWSLIRRFDTTNWRFSRQAKRDDLFVSSAHTDPNVAAQPSSRLMRGRLLSGL